MVEYWVTFGKDDKYYYFKRSRGHTKRISKDEYLRHEEGTTPKYSVTYGADGNYYYYKTVRGKKQRISAEEFSENADYLPNLHYVIRKINRDYVIYNNDLPLSYSLAHVPRVGVVSVVPNLAFVKRRPRVFLTSASPLPDCSTKWEDQNSPDVYDVATLKCADSGCTQVITVLSEEDYNKEKSVVSKLSGNVMPRLRKSWTCKQKNQGYFIHDVFKQGTLGKVYKEYNEKNSPLNDKQKKELYLKIQRLINTAHSKQITLGKSLSPNCMAVSGNFPVSYSIYLICASGLEDFSNNTEVEDYINAVSADTTALANFPATLFKEEEEEEE